MQRNNGVLGSVCIEAKKMRPSGRKWMKEKNSICARKLYS